MKNTRLVAVCAITAALIIVLSLIPPQWGIPFLGFIPVLVVVVCFRNIRMTLAMSLFAGVVSWIFSYIRPSIVGLAFQSNPLLPIIPRMCAGVLAQYSCSLAYKLSGKFLLCATVGAVVGSIANTVFVLGAIVLFVPSAYASVDNVWGYLIPIIPTAVIEIILNSVFTPYLAKVVLPKQYAKPNIEN